MSLLSNQLRQARTSLHKAKRRYESAGVMERHRLKLVIAERKKLLRVLNLLRRAHELGHDIFDRRNGTTRVSDIQMILERIPTDE